MKKIYLIDALGPFFLGSKQETINWSKVHFSELETEGRLSSATSWRIEQRFAAYITRVEELGYNSLSIDDLAHLAVLPWYSPELQRLLQDYRSLYRRLFATAAQRGLKVFINTDYLFLNQEIEAHLRRTGMAPHDFFKQVLEQVLRDFPEIEGVILRLGETDGKDVEGTFLSRLMLKTPAQLGSLLKAILPLFEASGTSLIVRTWTVGAYKIGDLIWNPKTYDAAFGSIQSPALIISMKFGETDFMRYLSLNPLLLSKTHQKIIELQTRREWEGMGLFPSFVGWDYADYLRQLKHNESFVGIHVWCQTGGWAKKAWTNVTYLDGSSFWNELNTEVTIAIAQGMSVEKAVTAFCQRRGIREVEKFIELLKLSEVAIMKGVYIQDLAQKNLYFRRARIPTLFWLTWDKILLSSTRLTVYHSLLSRNHTLIRDADEALEATTDMIKLAKEIALSPKLIKTLEFEHATLELFREIRLYMTGETTADTLQKHIDSYQRSYPQHYSVSSPDGKKIRRLPTWVVKTVVREKTPYRRTDKLLLKMSPFQLQVARAALRLSKSRLADQAMGIDMLFK